MDNTVRDFVNSIASGDNLDAETHFNNALSAKVGDALENKRKDVAKTFVTHHIPEVEEDSDKLQNLLTDILTQEEDCESCKI